MLMSMTLKIANQKLSKALNLSVREGSDYYLYVPGLMVLTGIKRVWYSMNLPKGIYSERKEFAPCKFFPLRTVDAYIWRKEA